MKKLHNGIPVTRLFTQHINTFREIVTGLLMNASFLITSFLLPFTPCMAQYEAGIYRFVRYNTLIAINHQLSLEVDASLVGGGSRVQFHSADPGTGDQQKKWIIVPAGKDADRKQLYYIINYRFKKALDTQLDPGWGRSLTVQQGTGDLSEKWYIEPGVYTDPRLGPVPGGVLLRSAETGTVVIPQLAEIGDFGGRHGVDEDWQYAILSEFTNLSIENADRYSLMTESESISFPNSPTGYYFLVPEYDNNKAVYIVGPQDAGNGQQAFCAEYAANSEAHQWKFTRDDQGYYHLENRRSHLLLSIGGGLMDNGSAAIGWGNWGGDDQKWSILPVEGQDGYYFLFNKNSGRALTVQREGDPSYTTEVRNGGMVQWMCRNLPAQKFKLVPALLPNSDNNVVVNNDQTNVDFAALLPPQNMYKILSLSNNKAVEVESGVLSSGTKVQQYQSYRDNGPAAADGSNQIWRVIPAGRRNNRPVFFIINNGFLKYLQAGDEMTVQTGNDEENQLWEIQTTNTTDVYLFRSVATGKYLQTAQGVEDGIALQTGIFTGGVEQQFRLLNRGDQSAPQNYGGYQPGRDMNICTKMNGGKAINIADASTDNGAPIQLFDVINGAGNEDFRFIRTTDGYYKIQSSSKCLDVTDWEAGNNSNLVSWDCADVEKQKWLIVPVVKEPGNYIFFNKVSGRCMDIANASTENGATIQTYLFVNQDNQKWQLRAAQ